MHLPLIRASLLKLGMPNRLIDECFPLITPFEARALSIPDKAALTTYLVRMHGRPVPADQSSSLADGVSQVSLKSTTALASATASSPLLPATAPGWPAMPSHLIYVDRPTWAHRIGANPLAIDWLGRHLNAKTSFDGILSRPPGAPLPASAPTAAAAQAGEAAVYFWATKGSGKGKRSLYIDAGQFFNHLFTSCTLKLTLAVPSIPSAHPPRAPPPRPDHHQGQRVLWHAVPVCVLAGARVQAVHQRVDAAAVLHGQGVAGLGATADD